MRKAVSSSETSVIMYYTLQCNILEERNVQINHITHPVYLRHPSIYGYVSRVVSSLQAY